MARSFTAANSQFLIATSVPTSGNDMSASVMFRTTQNSGFQAMLCVGHATDPPTILQYLALNMNVPKQSRWITVNDGDVGTETRAANVGSTVTNRWYGLVGREIASNDSSVVRDGVETSGDGTDTTAGTPNRLSVGATPIAATLIPLDGSLASAALWDTVLSASAAQIVSYGVSPLDVQGDDLVFYLPMYGSEDHDMIGQLTLTPAGTGGTLPGAGPNPYAFERYTPKAAAVLAKPRYGREVTALQIAGH